MTVTSGIRGIMPWKWEHRQVSDISDYNGWNIIYTERGWLRIGHITSGCSFQGHKSKVYEMRMREDEPHGVSCGWHKKHAHNIIPTNNKIKMQLFPFIPLNNTFSVSVYLLSFFLSSSFPYSVFCLLFFLFLIVFIFWTIRRLCQQLINIIWRSLLCQC